MTNLVNQKCVPCEGGIPPLSDEKKKYYLGKIKTWNLICEGIHRI